MFLSQHLTGSSDNVVEIDDQDFLGDMFMRIVGVLGEGGDEFVTGFEGD